MHSSISLSGRAMILLAVLIIALLGGLSSNAIAHPLGQLTINHFVRVETGSDRARIRYVVDFAEVSTFQETRAAGFGQNGTLSQAELDTFLEGVARSYVAGLTLTVDGAPVTLK